MFPRTIAENASANSNSTVQLWKLDGHTIPLHFHPGFVVLSFLISYIGACTTLELMHRRTSRRGFYNWRVGNSGLVFGEMLMKNRSLLTGAALSFGGIAVWSMHFIGNRAIILGNGELQLQIVYSPGFTALSFLIPVTVLMIAFAAIGANANEIVSITRVLLGGMLTGLGICGMHYLGQAGITNYDCVYGVINVIYAAVIAIVASVGALVLFFLFRKLWRSRWWKRAGAAAILAVAVSGMHWLACLGTTYRLSMPDPNQSKTLSRDTTVAVVIVFSIAGCLVLILFMTITQRQLMIAAKRAQQVVLAVAVFDPDGKILVSPDGFIPMRKITNSWVERSLNDVFNSSHPVFLWLFRTSRYWFGVKQLIPAMRSHVYRTGIRRRIGSRDNSLVTEGGTPIDDFTLVFQELFCLAAADLASDLGQPLEDVGMLYEEILYTGIGADDESKKPKLSKSRVAVRKSAASGASEDLEREALSGSQSGKGQLLFITRRATMREVLSYEAAGYKFADISLVLPIIATRLRIKPATLVRTLPLMIDFASEIDMLDPGVHMACFAVRAALGVGKHGGFDLLARRDAKNQLPTMQVPGIEFLEDWQKEYLNSLDNFPAAICMKQLNKASKAKTSPEKEKAFANLLLITLEALKTEIEDPFFNDALLIGKTIEAPCRGRTYDSPPGVCYLITFRTICPLHSRAPGRKLKFEPLNFFTMQQHTYKNAPDHQIFARRTYQSYKELLNLGKENGAEGGSFPNMKTHSGLSMSRSRRNGMQMGQAVDSYGYPSPTQETSAKSPGRIVFWSGATRSENRSSDDQNRSEQAYLVREAHLVEVSAMDTSRHQEHIPGIQVQSEVIIDTDDDDGSRQRSALASPGPAPKGNLRLKIPIIRFGEGTKKAASSISGHGDPDDTEDRKTYVDELFAYTIAKKGAVR